MVYTDLDYSDQWEYKTVHARKGEFGSQFHLQRVLEQEALAGWVPVELVDRTAVRLRRPVTARAHDHLLPPQINPYRTLYTYADAPDAERIEMAILWALVFIVLMLVVGVTVLFSVAG